MNLPFPLTTMTSYFQNAQKVVFQGTIITAGNYIQHGSVKGPLECMGSSYRATELF